jgi:hypothetical protein
VQNRKGSRKGRQGRKGRGEELCGLCVSFAPESGMGLDGAGGTGRAGSRIFWWARRFCLQWINAYLNSPVR